MNMQDEKFAIAITILLSFLMAAHAMNVSSFANLIGENFYWLIRFSAQALLFFGVRAILEKYSSNILPFLSLTFLAILFSHIPYALTITALDVILGLPELGLVTLDANNSPLLAEFAFELFILLDNHIAFCLLLSLPRWMLIHLEDTSVKENIISQTTILSAISPPLKGDILWVEAQEHYVQIATNEEKRMVLARFSDVIRELSKVEGTQIHRSHWVASKAISQEIKKGQSLKLLLITGDIVPVSRSFKNQLSFLKGK